MTTPVILWHSGNKWDYGGMKSESGGCRGRDSETQAILMREGNRDGVDTVRSGGLWVDCALPPHPRRYVEVLTPGTCDRPF